MCPYFEVYALHLPAYGIISSTVIILYIVLGSIRLYRSRLPVFDGCVLGAYGLLGAIIGSRLFYIAFRGFSPGATLREIYIGLVKTGGMASGGVYFGLCMVMLAGWLHKIDFRTYMNSVMFILPLCHGLWKIGCWCAGCCYGIPYHGFCSVVFPENSHAPSGIQLFPVQVVEVILFLGLAAFFYFWNKNRLNIIADYWIVYGVIRFLMEYLRNPDSKRMIMALSDTQWIDLLMIFSAVVVLLKEGKKNELKI